MSKIKDKIEDFINRITAKMIDACLWFIKVIKK